MNMDLTQLKTNTKQACTVLNRSAMTRLLVSKLTHGEAVIGGIGNNNFDLWASGQREHNFYMLGSMGLTSAIALGVAIAQPARRTYALEGDGSLLMQLGSLGTVAASGAENLVIVVWDNGIYQITGSQPTLTGQAVDLVGAARACGIEKSVWATSEDEFSRLIDLTRQEAGPWFIGVRVDGDKPAGVTERDPSKIRQRFMQALAS
ncbi:MAG: thiamine pyrophosphate-dependent enzyme [Pigmentiphaga sp.]